MEANEKAVERAREDMSIYGTGACYITIKDGKKVIKHIPLSDIIVKPTKNNDHAWEGVTD